MIVQQVNLYRNGLKPQQRSIDFYLGVVLFFLFFIGFSLINVYLIKNLHYKHHQVEQKRIELEATQTRVKLLESTISKQELDPALTSQVEQWQAKVESLKQTIAVLLNSNNTVRSQGFSAYFQALSNQTVSGVWLTTIHFDAEQQRIDFEGSTLKSDRIPYFLQQLQQEPIFQGRTFAQLQMEKSEQNPSLMNFKLSTHLEPEKKSHVQ